MNPLTINPNWKNKTEEEQTPLTITWGKNNTFSQPLFPETPPAPEIIPAPEISPAPETPAPTFTSSVLDIMGLGSAPLDAEQGRALMQTGQELMQKNQFNDWTGRQEMIDEYRKLQQSIQADDNAVAMGAMQPADYMDRTNRMNALRQQLEQGDIAAGNGPMAYSGQDRIANMLGGAGKNIASSLTSAAGTAGEAAGRAQRMEEEQNREQLFAPADASGFNTDRAKEAARQVSEAETANAHEKWATVQSAADRMGESAAQELQRAKNGLSKLGQAGVDISENIIEMGFDAAVAAATGGSSLIPMFARTFGSAASEARKDGASLDEQVLYGTTKAGIEVLTEKMFDGLAGVYGKGAADDITEKLIGKLAKSKEGATMLRVLFNGGGEMLEEFVSSIFDPMAKAIYQDIDISPNLSAFGLGDQPLSAEDARALIEAGKKPGYFSNVDVADMLYSGLIGFAIGAMGGGASIATGQNARANAELGFGTAPVEAAPEAAPAAPAMEAAAPEVAAPETAPIAPEAAPVETTEEAVIPEAAAETPVETAPEAPIVPEAPAQVTNESSPEEIANFLEQRAQAAEARGDAETAAAYRGMANAERARGMEQQTFNENPAQQNTQVQPAPEVNTNEAGFSMPENGSTADEAETPAGATSRTTENGPVSQTAETVRTSPDTNAETRAAIEEATEAGGFNYLPISNDETVRKARERINRDGFEATLAKWERAIVQGRTSADIIATGRLLYNDAQAQGNTQMALQVLSDLQAATTNAAQSLQIQRLFQSFNPQTRYNMLQRQIDNLSDKYQRQLPDGVKISDELKSEYINAESEEARDAALDKIRDSIAQQLPSTWRDKIRALRYLNMLGNFRTQGRNIIGNTAMSAVTSAKNAVQFGLERIAHGLSGGKTELTTSAFVDPAMIAAAKADYRENADAINGEAKYSDRAETGLAREAEEAKRIFKSRIMEGYRKLTNWAMTRGDTVFIGNRYARTFGGYLKANGMDAATLTGIQNGTIEPTKAQTELIDKARAYAAKEAQEATFHDDNVLSNWISTLGRKETTPKFARMLAEGIMPFRKTPANVLVRAEEYSPLGLLNTAYKAAQAARGEGNVTSSDVINQLSKSLTGTGLFLLGMALRNNGHLTGHEDDDKQREFNALRGDQEYALVFDDGTSFTLDWVAPASMPLFMGAQMMDIVADRDVSLDDLSDVFASLADPMIEMSMLQGLNDALDNLKYSDNNLGTIAANAALSYLTQIMSNTMLGQAERSFEDKRYSTFVNGNSKVGKMVERNLGKLSAKTPGWDRNQVEYIDAWGRTQDTGTPLARAATNFLSPGYVGRDRSTEVDDELQRLYDAGQNNVFPQRIPMSEKVSTYDRDGNRTGERALTADEYVTFQKEMGQKSLDLVKDLMDSKIYDKLTDDAKAEAISEIYKYAKNQAALKVEKSTKDENADVTGLSNIAGYYAVKAAFSEAAGNAKNRDYKALDKMLDEYKAMPKDVRALIDDKNSTIGKLSAAKDAGIDSKTYYSVNDGFNDLTPAEGYKTVAGWQKVESIGKTKLTDKQKDYFMEQQLEGGSADKYKACREADFRPKDIAAFYRIFNTTKGADANNDGRTDNGSKKKNVIEAAVKYGFSEKQATALYNMWQKGSWK